MKMINSWVGKSAWISARLDKNCWFFIIECKDYLAAPGIGKLLGACVEVKNFDTKSHWANPRIRRVNCIGMKGFFKFSKSMTHEMEGHLLIDFNGIQ